MHLERLYIFNYRNIEQAELELSAGTNCFVGFNGMGKTNVLDAVHYLSFCRSGMNPADAQTVRHGQECFMLKGTYRMTLDDTVDISCSCKIGSRKQIRRDGKDYQRFSDHIGLIPLVQISPADSELISGGSDERRRFMDLVISQYDREYLARLIDYNKALTQRNALLKQDNEPDAELLLMWETAMDRASDLIYKRRLEFTGLLVPRFQELYSRIGEGSEKVGLEYVSHLSRGSLLDQLVEGRSRDRAVGYTLHGIHKDDLEMTLDGFPIRKEGSQGQNKSYLTALKLAQYRFLTDACNGRRPLLLLDDLFDKLDSVRVERILRLVTDGSFGQTFITDVDRSHLDTLLSGIGCDYKVFTIENGNVK